MKIVYCTDKIDVIGGVERITVEKANALSHIKGNKVYIVVAYNRNPPHFPVEKGVEVINLDVRFHDCYSRNPLVWVPFYLKKKKEHRKKLKDTLLSISPDVIISTGQVLNSFLPTIKIPTKPLFIREFHSYAHYRLLEAEGLGKLRALRKDFIDCKLSTRHYDKIVILTHEDKENNWSHNPNAVVIPNMVTIDTAQVSSLENKTAIAAGRLVKQKNFQSLISAWQYVKLSHPDWKLKIYGDGVQKGELQQQIIERDLTENVELCGFTTDIAHQLTASSILISSSIYEGLPLNIIEAMACGLPVISYDYCCGPKDLIRNGENGYIVPLNDEKALSDRICELIENEDLRKRMGKASLEKSKDYSRDSIIQQWMVLFEQGKV